MKAVIVLYHDEEKGRESENDDDKSWGNATSKEGLTRKKKKLPVMCSRFK